MTMRNIMESKRGLSDVLATMMIILLVLVAIGIIWVVVRNFINQGTEQIDIGSKCLAVTLDAVGVVETAGVYAIALHRGSDSEGDLGVKVSVFNTAESSSVVDWGAFGDLDALGTVTKSVTPSPALVGGNRVDFTAFFKDASGNEQLCSQTTTFNF